MNDLRLLAPRDKLVPLYNLFLIGNLETMGLGVEKPWRNRGYASAALTRLCAELLAQGKQPCLFYDNPAAGVIYRRLGFEDIGPWNLVFLKQV